MDKQAELAVVRAAYAKQILAAAGVTDARLAQAFAAIHREDFVGPGPWLIIRWLRNYVPTPDADPVYLYTDDLALRHQRDQIVGIEVDWIGVGCRSAVSTMASRHCMPI